LLPDPTTPGYLIAKHEIVSLPSASVLALQRQELANRKPAPRGVAVVADPVFELKDQRVAQALNKRYKRETKTASTQQPDSKNQNEALASALRSVGADDTLHRLVMSRTEAAEIARVVPTNQLYEALDFQANRSLILNGALSKYRYVHLATHGVIDFDHPELSGIVLSMVDENGKEQDGYVRLYEIYNLNLPAELVVLSACQTGVGKQIKGEGLIALTRGFMYAGAARIVASLWKVDDSATAALMAQFYKEMFTNGKKPAAALRAAQKYMSEQRRWQSPYYWAGFVLQGEWR
jgi:CHAT domain-containing protein